MKTVLAFILNKSWFGYFDEPGKTDGHTGEIGAMSVESASGHEHVFVFLLQP
jgi:hypothetical protein